MTKEELAARLTGREMGEELTEAEDAEAKAAGLVVCFGHSDDNLELRGAIYDEVSAWRGTTLVLYRARHGYECTTAETQAIRELEDDAALEAAFRARRLGITVTAVANPKDLNANWHVISPLPGAAFDVLEKGRLFCRGVVLDVADLPL